MNWAPLGTIGHHQVDLLFMFLKQIPQISQYYIEKSTTGNIEFNLGNGSNTNVTWNSHGQEFNNSQVIIERIHDILDINST